MIAEYLVNAGIGCDEQGQDVGFGLALDIVDVDEQQERLGPSLAQRHGYGVGNGDLANRASLAGEPTSLVEEPRQRAFEPPSSLAPHDVAPVGPNAQDRQVRARRRETRPVRSLGDDGEPIEPIGSKRQVIVTFRYVPELRGSEQLPEDRPAVVVEIERDALGEPGQVRDHEDTLVLVAAQKGEHLGVLRVQELNPAATEHRMTVTKRDETAHPPQQRVRIAVLRLDVDRLVVVLGIDDDREIELLGVGGGEARVAVRAPLHRRSHCVSVAEVEVVAHAELIAVVHDRRPRQREQQTIE